MYVSDARMEDFKPLCNSYMLVFVYVDMYDNTVHLKYVCMTFKTLYHPIFRIQ